MDEIYITVRISGYAKDTENEADLFVSATNALDEYGMGCSLLGNGEAMIEVGMKWRTADGRVATVVDVPENGKVFFATIDGSAELCHYRNQDCVNLIPGDKNLDLVERLEWRQK